MSKPVIERGSIWKENIDRERFVRVDRLGTEQVLLRTVYSVDGVWTVMPKSRPSFAAITRFNGQRGGYSFHEMPSGEGIGR